MCLVLFAPFITLGVIICHAGPVRENVGRLYFADLVGAGLGCLLAIPLITVTSRRRSWPSPPSSSRWWRSSRCRPGCRR